MENSLYQLPPAELLTSESTMAAIECDLAQTQEPKSFADEIKRAFYDNNILVRSVDETCGPAATRYRISFFPGTLPSKVLSKHNKIIKDIEETAKRPARWADFDGQGNAEIEIPHGRKCFVTLKSVVESKQFSELSAVLPIAIGRTYNGEERVFDLTKLHHIMIAGSPIERTSCLQSIIASLLCRKKPSELKFLLIDSEGICLSPFENMGDGFLVKMSPEHSGLITDTCDALRALIRLRTEMERRYTSFKEARVRNIAEYNKRSGEEERMPYLVVAVNDCEPLALMPEFEMTAAMILQKARATGIHFVIASRRCNSVKIKISAPTRIAFQMGNTVESWQILDKPGAEKLCGRGDMLLLTDKLERVQGAYAYPADMKILAEYTTKQAAGEPPFILTAIDEAIETINFDALFRLAACHAAKSGKVSISGLQRLFFIGYNRAKSIVNQLEAAGFIDSNKQVLISGLANANARLKEMDIK